MKNRDELDLTTLEGTAVYSLFKLYGLSQNSVTIKTHASALSYDTILYDQALLAFLLCPFPSCFVLGL